jgi:hypothetical protein
LSLGKPLQPSLMCASKAGACPSGAPLGLPSRLGSHPYPQFLDQLKKFGVNLNILFCRLNHFVTVHCCLHYHKMVKLTKRGDLLLKKLYWIGSRLEKLTSDKHSSLFRLFVGDDEKSFITLTPEDLSCLSG